ncbi:MAG: sigma-54-dependent Fis family transcriptional regulator, partial [Deltaproteobacteria bacterium]|nr:sigma-54-dependent Fis family transcriptional regulator [Deltaproteobacteria bacterium]
GKELVARTIHYTGHRKDNLFVKVDCTALTETLLDSVLFGHVVSSADGTISKKKGKLEEADGGTLFFNEITDIPPSLQAKLLKFLEAKELETKPEKSSRKIDVRVIAATKKDIQKFINEGSFSEELYNRINEIPITIPRLRDRKTDIPFLIDHFIKRLRSQGEKPVVKCDQHTIDQLMKYNWRGNIRELENTIEYAFLTCRTDTIRFHNIPQQIKQRLMIEGITTDKKRNANDERVRIANALKMTQGNKTRAAVLLGYSRITLWKNIKRLGVEV